MDIRIEKTKQSIINAFIEIRSRKEVERITVKELCEKARINKSTFYAHYKDIYDLSDQLETELVDSIMENFNHPENLLQNPADFTKEIFMGYMAKDTLIRTLFSGSRSKFLVQKMESALKALGGAGTLPHPEGGHTAPHSGAHGALSVLCVRSACACCHRCRSSKRSICCW